MCSLINSRREKDSLRDSLIDYKTTEIFGNLADNLLRVKTQNEIEGTDKSISMSNNSFKRNKNVKLRNSSNSSTSFVNGNMRPKSSSSIRSQLTQIRKEKARTKLSYIELFSSFYQRIIDSKLWNRSKKFFLCKLV